jgi:hypothetical protein
MKRALFAFVAAGLLLTQTGFIKPQAKTPSDLLLSDKPPQASIFFNRLAQGTVKNKEKAKIEYLVERIRHSKHRFIRNGAVYSSGRAASFMLWKLQQKGSRIHTAEQFIYDIASKSATTGKDYLIKTKNGRLFPIRDVLLNELIVLDSALKQKNV